MRIWDAHCHPTGPRAPGGSLTGKVESILAVATRVGIERLGLVFTPSMKEDEVLRICDRHRDRVLGFIWLSLWNETPEANLARIDRLVRDGPLIGVKLGGESGHCNELAFDAVYRRAGELRAVVYQHTWLKLGGEPRTAWGGTWPRESTPMQLAELARRHPEVQFLCGHTGGNWELGIRAIRDVPNISADISGGFPTRGEAEMAVRELGVRRVVYGSDITGRGFASQLAKVYGADLPARDKELIFSGNLIRLMRPMLKTKGLPVPEGKEC